MPLVPGRFLALVAHLGLLLRMGGDPPKNPSGDLEPGFWGALGGSLALLGVEFLGFLSGVSMFHPGQGLGSAALGAHGGAALGLALGWLEAWDGPALWATLVLSVPPGRDGAAAAGPGPALPPGGAVSAGGGTPQGPPNILTPPRTPPRTPRTS